MKAAALGALLSTAAFGYCPSYTLSSAYNSGSCGVEAAPGTNPTPTQWQAIFALVSQGPSAWGSNGPAVADIGSGCGSPNPTTSVPARFPCELLKAIAMQESSWKQFCVPDTPADQVGGASRTIIAFDCGYGIGQVTSGMKIGNSPSFDRARVASDPTYNLATGTQILADKWRSTRCVGDNQPGVIEDWYTATWAYNGQSYSNNPSNPAYSSTRGVWNPQVQGSAPYQEKVFGWMEHPPGASYWAVTAVAYPDPALVGSSGVALTLPDSTCASPTNCVATRALHLSSCFRADAGGFDAGPPDAGVKDAGLWDAGFKDAGAADGGPRDAGVPRTLLRLPETFGGAPESRCGCGSGGPTALVALGALIRVCRRRRAADQGR